MLRIGKIEKGAHFTAPDAPLGGGVLSKKIECSVTNKTEFSHTIIFSGAMGVLSELCVKYPVLLIFDSPVITDNLRNA
ncbi:MAG: hypothetical protein H7240_04370 [Glaciimonas sp.]|nr:hypothetical protein [Glaciimonas sp.]